MAGSIWVSIRASLVNDAIELKSIPMVEVPDVGGELLGVSMCLSLLSVS